MDHRKPLPLSAEQMEELLQGEKSVDDIVRETSQQLRKEIAEIFRASKTKAKPVKRKARKQTLKASR